ncbi:MAG: hypothetical protein CMJ23_04710 [Phycisphaerae bacterium]|nr:hypothetical protein [Phycisphaerae bacterium]
MEAGFKNPCRRPTALKGIASRGDLLARPSSITPRTAIGNERDPITDSKIGVPAGQYHFWRSASITQAFVFVTPIPRPASQYFGAGLRPAVAGDLEIADGFRAFEEERLV